MDPVTDRDLARLHYDMQKKARWLYNPRTCTKEIEATYREQAIALMAARGIGPITCRPANGPADLDVAGRLVELKVGRAHPRPGRRTAHRYQAAIAAPTHRHYLRAEVEVVLFLCVDPLDTLWPFIIPARLLVLHHNITINSHPSRYAGRWAPYLHAWDCLFGSPSAGSALGGSPSAGSA